MPDSVPWIAVRRADEADLPRVVTMMDDFASGHPSKGRERPVARLAEAYFGRDPVARIYVAEKRGKVVGMAQWTRIYDMFWDMFGGRAEWLYVCPDARGLGIAAALIAAICEDIRASGGELLCGGASEEVARLYDKVAASWPSRDVYLSAEAFQVFADLAGASPRELIRGLPDPGLNRQPPRPRS